MGKIARVTGVSYEWLAAGRGAMLPDSPPEEPPTPAIDADFVEDPLERQLLEAFRLASLRVRRQAMKTLKTSARRYVE